LAGADHKGVAMTVNESADDLVFNPFDPDQTRTSWEKLARMRRECPVSRPFEHFIYTAKYDDSRDVFRDGRRFFYGPSGMRKPGTDVPYEERFLGEIDPPEHPGLRRLMHRFFTPAAAQAEEPYTRAYVRRGLEDLARAGGGEFRQSFSDLFPIAITAHVLGMPTEHIDSLTRDMVDIQDTESFLSGNIGVVDAFPQLSAYADAAIDERLAADEPPDDVITAMLTTDLEGGRMAREQARTLIVNLLAGSTSTTATLDNLVYRLASDAGFEAALRGDRALIARAVEESLRLEPPVLFLFRQAKVDTELSGVPVHEGERICMGIGSANRDEERYHQAEEFRLDRRGEPEHLSFGWGPHLCLGVHLARMEARVMLEELLDLFPPGGLALAPGYQFEFMPGDFLRYGPHTVDLVVTETTR
jgi:cytochrome P450